MHDRQKGLVGLNTGGAEAIQDHLSSSFELFIDLFGEDGVDDLKEGGEFLSCSFDFSREMNMVIHEVVGVEGDVVFALIFEQEVVIEFFGPIVLDEPMMVMALPGDVEDGAIPDDLVSRAVGHRQVDKQVMCQESLSFQFIDKARDFKMSGF